MFIDTRYAASLAIFVTVGGVLAACSQPAPAANNAAGNAAATVGAASNAAGAAVATAGSASNAAGAAAATAGSAGNVAATVGAASNAAGAAVLRRDPLATPLPR